MPKLDLGAAPLKTGSIYPEPYKSRMAGRSSRRLGDLAGLTQFGVNIVTLELGAVASLRHWHLRALCPVHHGGIGRRRALHVTQQGVRVATDDRIDPRHLGCQFQIAQIADMGQGDDLVDALGPPDPRVPPWTVLAPPHGVRERLE